MKLIIIAPNGKMGRLITKISSENNELKIVAGVGNPGREYIGQDIGIVTGLGHDLGALVVDRLEDVINKCDVIVDFSNVELSMKVIEAAVKYKKSLVCGTTGFSARDTEKIHEASKEIPLLFASNTSRIVNLMNILIEITAKTIGKLSDIEIIEMHDAFKKDAPSGTSKEMGEIIAHAMEKELKDVAVHGREGSGERIFGSIGYHSIWPRAAERSYSYVRFNG